MRAAEPPFREIRFAPLEFGPSTICVRWTVDPPSSIYTRTSFNLDFGQALDPAILPPRLWWTLVLMCLNTHWNLLRPCRIVLPVRLPGAEVETWLRLLDHQRDCLEALRGGRDFTRSVELVCEGAAPEDFALPSPHGGFATAYSGGRDSMLQAVVLQELGIDPLLVHTRSPMPPLREQSSPQYTHSLPGLAERRHLELTVVQSDLRTSWPHYEAPHEVGYQISMPLLSDTSLFLAATVAVAAGRGMRTALLAAEFESALPERYVGRLVFPPMQFTYSPVMLGAYSRLLAPWGIECCSLLFSLTGFQRQELLATLGRDVLPVQFSCFRMQNDTDRYCSRCSKCFRIAMVLMALDIDPAELGINVNRLLTDPSEDLLQTQPYFIDVFRHSAQLIDTARARRFFREPGWRGRLLRRTANGASALERMVADLRPGADPGWVRRRRPSYDRFLPADLHEGIARLFEKAWPEVDSIERQGDVDLMETTLDWITEPLY